MDPYVGDRCGGVNGRGRIENRRAEQFGNIDVNLGHLRAAHCGGYGVSPRVARVLLQRRKVVVLARGMVVLVGYRCMMVFVRGWAVMVLRMIVAEILVHVQRRPHGRRDDQSLNQRACDEATHRISLL